MRFTVDELDTIPRTEPDALSEGNVSVAYPKALYLCTENQRPDLTFLSIQHDSGRLFLWLVFLQAHSGRFRQLPLRCASVLFPHSAEAASACGERARCGCNGGWWCANISAERLIHAGQPDAGIDGGLTTVKV